MWDRVELSLTIATLGTIRLEDSGAMFCLAKHTWASGG